MTTCRGIRGATTVARNEPEAIWEATQELLQALVEANGLDPCDLASAIFTVTGDLDAAFPATAARRMGWHDVPLLDAREIAVPGSLPRCIRVLLHWNTDRTAAEIVHVYLHAAQVLRPEHGERLNRKQGTSPASEGRGRR